MHSCFLWNVKSLKSSMFYETRLGFAKYSLKVVAIYVHMKHSPCHHYTASCC